MKTTEFRCKECNKLLAKVVDDQFTAKCSRCGEMNVHKADITYDQEKDKIIISDGHASMYDVVEFMASKDEHFAALKKRMDTEALEALKRVSRHGDNV